MRLAMAEAEVGDDVYGEDPTVNRLQALAAEMLGTEAALFATSGTQSNLLGVMSQCERGDEYIVGQRAHTYRFEGGGAAVLGSIQPQPIDFQEDGTLDLGEVARNIKPNDFHFAQNAASLPGEHSGGQSAPPRLSGKGLPGLPGKTGFPSTWMVRACSMPPSNCKVPVREITRHFDTISFCLSKGLGAPVGSVLVRAQRDHRQGEAVA